MFWNGLPTADGITRSTSYEQWRGLIFSHNDFTVVCSVHFWYRNITSSSRAVWTASSNTPFGKTTPAASHRYFGACVVSRESLFSSTIEHYTKAFGTAVFARRFRFRRVNAKRITCIFALVRFVQQTQHFGQFSVVKRGNPLNSGTKQFQCRLNDYLGIRSTIFGPEP